MSGSAGPWHYVAGSYPWRAAARSRLGLRRVRARSGRWQSSSSGGSRATPAPGSVSASNRWCCTTSAPQEKENHGLVRSRAVTRKRPLTCSYGQTGRSAYRRTTISQTLCVQLGARTRGSREPPWVAQQITLRHLSWWSTPRRRVPVRARRPGENRRSAHRSAHSSCVFFVSWTCRARTQ